MIGAAANRNPRGADAAKAEATRQDFRMGCPAHLTRELDNVRVRADRDEGGSARLMPILEIVRNQ
jgi:hypothetical protein